MRLHSCSVLYCWVQYAGSCAMYRFPDPEKNEALFRKWLEVSQVQDLYDNKLTPQEIYKSCKICEHHFHEDDFDQNNLRKGVVPRFHIPSQYTDEFIDENTELHPYDDPTSPLFYHSYAKR